MEINSELTDDTILGEIGQRLAARRLELSFTQASTAEQAGISKRTLERIEAGHSCQLVSLIRVMRVLEVMHGLETLLPTAEPRPMDLLKRKGKQRQRASRQRNKTPPSSPWQRDKDA